VPHGVIHPPTQEPRAWPWGSIFHDLKKEESMPKVIIALLILIFCFVFLLLIWIIFLSLALLLFSKKEKKGENLRPPRLASP
jgi:hypothetical protein